MTTAGAARKSGGGASLVPGSHVWVQDAEDVWVPGEVVGASVVAVKTCKGTEKRQIKSADVVHLRNTDPLTGKDILTDDLVNLAHLHEPALLHVLQERFLEDQIYTFTGSILLAVNPFKNVPNLYSEELMHSYLAYEPYMVQVESGSGTKKGRPSLKLDPVGPTLERLSSSSSSRDLVLRATATKKTWEPSAFATAARAYKGILESRKSQVILISGESGSGKTETTKFVMRFLVQAGPLLQCNIPVPKNAGPQPRSSVSIAAGLTPLAAVGEDEGGGVVPHPPLLPPSAGGAAGSCSGDRPGSSANSSSQTSAAVAHQPTRTRAFGSQHLPDGVASGIGGAGCRGRGTGGAGNNKRLTNWARVRRTVQSLGSHVDNQVLQTNPLLEAFGNAKT